MQAERQWFHETRAKAVIQALKGNRINGYFVQNRVNAVEQVLQLIPNQSLIAMGGSMTLFETGIYDAIKKGNYNLIDRFEKGISQDEALTRLKTGLTADIFLAGVNAVTEQGELVFVDASCTRVAPILFGPQKVILVSGCNKIVPNLAYAQERIRHFVAPANARRLGRKTPCAKTGKCEDCSSPDRICNATVVIHKQAFEQRLHLVLVGETLGL
ncbi:lactate utilization protein [Dethiosulfatarculus sandiegensis]|uniref:LUD domain-containing protein n=1 Tax=Dethiosulfatarculus sandiegensis TaxID=1429043 RepID=A0A0D2JR26_9BACT|nr:lactate utilization protein [Dethiosulfatarculus sandiegensis]KIX11935.1 hypothetical protein X474_21635 [Dethiosulfatarculus sandiegensis]